MKKSIKPGSSQEAGSAQALPYTRDRARHLIAFFLKSLNQKHWTVWLDCIIFLRLLSVSKFNFCFLLSFNSIYSTISSLTIIILDGMKGSKIVSFLSSISIIPSALISRPSSAYLFLFLLSLDLKKGLFVTLDNFAKPCNQTEPRLGSQFCFMLVVWSRQGYCIL